MSVHVNTITRHSIRNYGSFLQSLATQEILRQAGATTRFVDYRQANVDDTGWSFAARGKAGKYGVLGTALYASLRHPNVRHMGRIFESEIKRHFALTEQVYRSAHSLEESTEFDERAAYCVGSDQVWNISHNLENRPYYLSFAPDGALKFSLASSIGMKELPPADEAALVRALSQFSAVSVREQEAVEYLAGLGISAQHHVDPTLGIPRSFWDAYAGESEGEKEPYLLVYQLNGSAKIPDIVQSLSRELGMPVRRIEYWRHYRRGTAGRKIVLPSMSAFVRLFRDASFVVTDSFHGTAFSTIFERPFVAVSPPKFGGRIESLLSLTNRERLLTNSTDAALEVATDRAPLPSVEHILEAERLRLSQYVKATLARVPAR